MSAVALTGLVIVGFYVWTYVHHRFAVPLGWDSPGYAWRTRLAQTVGVGGLPSVLPNPGPVNPGRPGFLVLGGIVSSLAGVDPLRVTVVMPAVMAAAAGLAWGASARAILGWGGWRSLAVALFVGTSPFLVHAIGIEGYQDATMALAVFSAATVAVLLAARDGRALWPAAILVGAAATIHWSFVPVVEGVLGLTALASLPSALRSRSAGIAGPARSVSVRLATIGVMGAAVAAFWITVLLPARLPHAELVVPQLLDKLRRDLPQLGLWLALPLAAIGAVSLAGDDRAEATRDEPGLRRTAFLWLTLAWCQVALLAVAALWLLGWAIPGHRVLAFCLAIPALAAVGLVWLGDRAAGLTRRRTAIAVVVVLAGLVLSGAWAQRTWLAYRPVMRTATVSESETAAALLDRAEVPHDRPIVFVLDDRGTFAWSRTWIEAHTIRVALPPGRLAHAYFYVGNPEDLLAGRATTLPANGPVGPGRVDPGTYDNLSATFFHDVRPILRGSPVVLMLASTDPSFASWIAANPASALAPGVALVRDGAADGIGTLGVHSRSAAAPSGEAVIGLALVTFVLVSLIGAGWTFTLLGRWLDGWATAALAPAVGTGILVLGGVALGRTGIRPDLLGGAAIVVMLTLAGLIRPLVSLARVRARAVRPDGVPRSARAQTREPVPNARRMMAAGRPPGGHGDRRSAMAGNPVHFEIPADDTAKGRVFWGSLFGWEFQEFPGPFEYHMARIDDRAGAAITNMEPGKRGIRAYFDVDDINDGVTRVKELGGESGAPGPVPGMGWFAVCKDPDGNEFGLWQTDPSAPGAAR